MITKLEQAQAAAEDRVVKLRPGCQRIEIAGKICHGEPEARSNVNCGPGLNEEQQRTRS